jgi:hypothetical protein
MGQVLHFGTQQEFKNIWPITDKSQSKDFNQVGCVCLVAVRKAVSYPVSLRALQKVNDWFKELREKHQLESIGSMTVSQLRSATGHRCAWATA